ncbi:MAG: hypothetical protein IMZ62_05930, partial [Chloroflexi bacterium]|nr:hypothetical protein [Chloroflexota bacterium]
MSNPQQPAANSNWKRLFFMVWTAQVFSLIGSGPVDRWNRRLLMMVADRTIAAATLAVAVLFWSGHIQTWPYPSDR